MEAVSSDRRARNRVVCFRMYSQKWYLCSIPNHARRQIFVCPHSRFLDLGNHVSLLCLLLYSSFASCTHRNPTMSPSTPTTADSFLFSSILGLLIVAVSYFIMTNLATSRRQRYEILENRERQRAMDSHLPRPSRGTKVMMDWNRDDAENVFCARCGKEVRE